MVDYPTQLDEIDQWLADNFGILPGACASTENLRHNTARMIAEALWQDKDHIADDSKKASGDSKNSNDQAYDEYMKCLDAAIEEYERRDKDVYCHETSFRWGFEAGADWQREQDKETIELAEDHAMLAGMIKKEEQMKEDAIELTVYEDAGGYPRIPAIEMYDYEKDEPTAKKGDKVKVYIFKNGGH